MKTSFPIAPKIEGFTCLNVKIVSFKNRRKGKRESFPVYCYRHDATEELVAVADDRAGKILDKLTTALALGRRETQA